MANNKTNILFIGCGNMGSAILKAIQDNNNFKIFVIDRNFKNSSSQTTTVKTIKDFNEKIDILILGMKPQSLNNIDPAIKPKISLETLIVSLLAGTNTNEIEEIFGSDKKVVRLMPNIAALKQTSTSSCFFNGNNNEKDKNLALSIFENFGICEILSDEADMHISTIINGGAIAYFALIIKYMKKAALKNSKSLTSEQLDNLIYNTYQNLLDLNIDEDEIIKLICSKKGTTETVINSLKQQNIEAIIENAIDAGVSRSIELSKGNN